MIVVLILILIVQLGFLWLFKDYLRCYKANLKERPLPMITLPKKEPKETEEYKAMKTVMENIENYDGTGRNQERL